MPFGKRIGIVRRSRSREASEVIIWSWKTRLAVLTAAVLLGLFLWWLLFLRGFGTVVMATGQAGGTYTVIGKGLSEFAEEADARFRVETIPSKGTPENLRLLENGEADFAIVQSGQATSDEVRVVARLHSEILHILVPRESSLNSISGLEGKRLCLGEEGSGSRVVSLPLLAHFGVEVTNEVQAPPGEALARLQQGEVDAVFLVTALHSEVICEAVEEGKLRFLSLGISVPGLVARFPYLSEATVPAMTYSCSSFETGAMPGQGVTTVGVPSLLVCRKSVRAEVVYEVTKGLFASRNRLTDLTPEAYQIAEIGSSDLFPWAVHEGAQRYYRRQEPGFLERYAEVMAFIMSLGAASWAVWGTVSRWSSKKKKGRIDEYYLEVAAAFVRLEEDDLSLDSLGDERARLRKLRSGAFQDLADEKLKADDSFEIFQNQLALCLDDVRRREERLR